MQIVRHLYYFHENSHCSLPDNGLMHGYMSGEY